MAALGLADRGHLLRVVRGPRRARSRHHGRGRQWPHRHLEGRLAHGRGQAGPSASARATSTISSIHYLLVSRARIERDEFIIDTPKVAHNTYLQILAELGIVGLALFLSIIGFAISCALKAARWFGRAGDTQMELVRARHGRRARRHPGGRLLHLRAVRETALAAARPRAGAATASRAARIPERAEAAAAAAGAASSRAVAACRSGGSAMGLTTKLIGALGSAGRPGRELGVRLDMLRSTGVRYARQRRREEALLTALASDPRQVRLPRDLAARRPTRWAPSCRVIHGEFLELRAGRARARGCGATGCRSTTPSRCGSRSTRPPCTRSCPRAGLPLPEHEEWDASKLNGAVEFLERSPTPCVVKPTGGASGSGATTGVRTRDQLLRARLRGGAAVAPPADRAPGRGRHVPAAVHGRRAARHGAPPPAARDRRRPLAPSAS